MNHKYQLSIVMATYNADIEKVYKSLLVACKQIAIDYEIIIADDGSKNFDQKSIDTLFDKIGFANYKIIHSTENQGTVKNLLNATKQAEGEYVFFTAPGDIIFDTNVMSDFYKYAKQNDAKLVFGNYIEYGYEDNQLTIYSRPNRPIITEVYNRDFKNYKTAFCFGTFITGAVFFREKEYALKSLEYISNTSKYVEDNTTAAYALADNQEIKYFDRKMVWYELGEGISTSKDKKWSDIIYGDLKNTFKSLSKDNPKDRILNVGCASYFRKYGVCTKIIIILAHPLLCARLVKNKMLPKQITKCTENEKEFLESILKK